MARRRPSVRAAPDECRCDRCHPELIVQGSSWLTDYKWEHILDEKACDECRQTFQPPSAVENCWRCEMCLVIFHAWLVKWEVWEAGQRV